MFKAPIMRLEATNSYSGALCLSFKSVTAKAAKVRPESFFTVLSDFATELEDSLVFVSSLSTSFQ